MLESPSDQDLRRRLAVLRRDFLDDGMLEATSAGERAVRFELDPPALAIFEELPLVEERMELDLIDGRRNRGRFQQLLEVRDRVIAHADGTREALLPQLQERFP